MESGRSDGFVFRGTIRLDPGCGDGLAIDDGAGIAPHFSIIYGAIPPAEIEIASPVPEEAAADLPGFWDDLF